MVLEVSFSGPRAPRQSVFPPKTPIIMKASLTARLSDVLIAESTIASIELDTNLLNTYPFAMMSSSSFAQQRRLGGASSSAHVQFHQSSYDRMDDSDASSTASSEDEETRLRREEAEEKAFDRAMAERYGEAEESNHGRSTDNKRPQTEEEIAAEYEKEQLKAKRRKRAPDLDIKDLTGVDGLIRLPTEFKALKYKKLSKASSKEDSIKAAAAYALSLTEAYKSFCYSMAPNLAFEDALLKIESYGSKKEVKSYLQQMRNDVRNRYVEKVFGKEKAEKMLQEFEFGQQGVFINEAMAADDEAGQNMEDHTPAEPMMTRHRSGQDSSPSPLAVSAPANHQGSNMNLDDDEENEATFQEETGANDGPNRSHENGPVASSSTKNRTIIDDEDDEDDAMLAEMEGSTNVASKTDHDAARPSQTNRRRNILDDEDDDEDDEPVGTTTEPVANSPKPSASDVAVDPADAASASSPMAKEPSQEKSTPAKTPGSIAESEIPSSAASSRDETATIQGSQSQATIDTIGPTQATIGGERAEDYDDGGMANGRLSMTQKLADAVGNERSAEDGSTDNEN